MLLNDLLIDDKPREKLLKNGAKHLSNAELLALLLRTGVRGKSSLDLARELLKKFGGLSGLLVIDKKKLCSISGIGDAKFCQIQAAAELMRRELFKELSEKPILDSSAKAKKFLALNLNCYEKEVFAALFLDNQHRLIAYEELFFGTINCANVYPREIVKKALEYNAAALIVAHNHPSGNDMQSTADLAVTNALKRSLELVDIRLLDHIIIANNST
ncbi:MAG: DNA repair protein RadC [Gammaproteobacteria bacterium]|nr:DNA repair protein RadC [Gammaproteobacteria bacterium]